MIDIALWKQAALSFAARRRKPVIAAAVVLAVILARLTIFGPAKVAAVRAARGPLAAEAFGTGTLEAKVVVALSAKITGKVAAVLVDQGDEVKAGQVVARLEATDFEDAVRVAKAGVAQAQAELEKARLDIERKRKLLDATVISQADFDGFESAYLVAKAKLKNAQAQLGFARARLDDTVIASPARGVVVTRDLEVNDTVVPGSPIFHIADTRLLWVAAMVDERVAGGLRVGQPARVVFRADPGRAYKGRLARLSQEADRVTEEQEADVRLDELPSGWFFGSKADVYIETAREPNALQLPRRAIASRGPQAGVFVVSRGRARWRPVTLGISGPSAVEITEGLEASENVIADPFAGKKPITDGQRVAAKRVPGTP